MLTPLLVLKTVQPDLAHAAAELGIRTMFAVASWDHLSSKAALDCAPQQVVVWNAVQAREAIELHGVDADRIVVTGSQLFDEWFTRRPATSREAFCARVGLRPDRPIVLYVGSSLLEASTAEPAFAARWARALRNSGSPVLWDCGILVRPHYERGSAWRRIDLAGLDNIACWPKVGDAPVDARSRADFFDSIYHAAAVVGLNTSAMIEAAIVGRPVHTVLLPEFHDHQEGTVHFHYLLEEPAALLRATRSLDDHARQLAHVLEGRDPDPDRSSRFVQRFVRPRGLGVPATQWFVEAVEALADRPAPAPVREPAWFERLQPIARWLLRRYADAAVEQVRRADEASRIREAERLLAHRRSKAPVLSEHRRQAARRTPPAQARSRRGRARRRVKILFLVHNLGKTRHFEGVVQELTARGHAVVLTAAHKRNKPLKLGGPFARDPLVDVVSNPIRRLDQWEPFVRPLRLARDYVRFLDPTYAQAEKLTARAQTYAPAGWAERLSRSRLLANHPDLVKRMLELAESLVPSEAYYEMFIRSHAPDVVLVTPLIDFGSYQTDYVKSAHALGIPIAFLPFSWDNLTNRGLVRIAPDRVLVWNEHQKHEAVTYHDVPSDRIVVTGAARFDDFFAMRPSTTQAEFCARAGLDPSRPFLLYLCSSHFVAPAEVSFVRAWARAVRSDPSIGECGILVRPHPANADAVGGGEPRRPGERSRLEGTAQGAGGSGTLRVAVPLRCGRRSQHERDDRGRDSREVGAHHRDGRVRGRTGADAALSLPAHTQRRTGRRRRRFGGALPAAVGRDREPVGGCGAQPPLRPGVRPAARPGTAGLADHRR